jgi:hypothetical protein
VPVEAELFERLVEGNPVTVAFGVRQGAVYIENESFYHGLET